MIPMFLPSQPNPNTDIPAPAPGFEPKPWAGGVASSHIDATGDIKQAALAGGGTSCTMFTRRMGQTVGLRSAY